MDLGLRGRVALITGGSGGIGAATARAYVAAGARVALTYRQDTEAAEKLAAELDPAGERAVALRYALGEPGTVESVVDRVVARLGAVDVLVANAMRWAPRRRPGGHVEDVPPGDWAGFLRDNLEATIRTVQLALPGMRAQGWGRVVLVSSHVVRDGRAAQEFYAAAKAGLHGLARSLAWDVGPDGILVNAVAPGLTDTDRVRSGLPPAVREGERSLTATGRLSAPSDVAAAVLFLGSGANGNISGEVLTVAGGR